MARSKLGTLLERWRRQTPADEADAATRNPGRALVLERDEVTRQLLVGMLEAEGLAVSTVRSGLDALAHLRHKPVDLVFLSTERLVRSTFSILAEIRRWLSSEELVVIVALRHDQADEELAAIAAGADDCLVKPLHLSTMRDRVRARLRGRRPSVRVVGDESEIAGVGTILDGKYQLDQAIGRGNYGTVYRAHHVSLEREVAIKILHPRFSNSGDLDQRLRQEGVSACRVDHPNAVAVLDLSLTHQGTAYLVMELLRGRTLMEELSLSKHLSATRCAEVLLPVCGALTQIHDLGMVHLDIKPANIFLHQGNAGEVVKVLDFGIVRMLAQRSKQGTRDRQIHTDTFEGTPSYASPERLTGDPFDEKADIYSLGIILYEMLTGLRPFAQAKNPIQLIKLVAGGQIQSMRELDETIPEDLDRLATQALSSEPADRPSAAEMARILTAFLQHSSQDNEG